jgi:hypothetical protein
MSTRKAEFQLQQPIAQFPLRSSQLHDLAWTNRPQVTVSAPRPPWRLMTAIASNYRLLLRPGISINSLKCSNLRYWLSLSSIRRRSSFSICYLLRLTVFAHSVASQSWDLIDVFARREKRGLAHSGKARTATCAAPVKKIDQSGRWLVLRKPQPGSRSLRWTIRQ